MNLTRHNFEEYFLLYLDRELEPHDREAVEAFLMEHPDLGEELDALRKTYLAPEEAPAFGGKALLYKQEEQPRASVVRMGGANASRKLLAAAATLLLLVGATWFWREASNGRRDKPGVAATHPRSPKVPGQIRETPPSAPAPSSRIAVAGQAPHHSRGARLASPEPASSESPANGHGPALDLAALTPLSNPELPAVTGVADFAGTHPVAVNEKNSVNVVTSVSPIAYHSLNDTDQEEDDNRILFLRQDLVLTSGVQGFFRKAGRMILRRGVAIGNDHLHPGGSGTEDE